MLQRLARFTGVLLVLGGTLSGCQTPSEIAAAGPPKPEIPFLDLQGFDRELAVALADPLPKVDVPFYDRIVPSSMPERLQNWMAAVESGGGKVKVTPPKSSVTPKDPFLLFSLVSSIWKASGMAQEMSTKAQFRSAHGYDAEILLKQDDKGDTVVDRVIFTQRKK